VRSTDDEMLTCGLTKVAHDMQTLWQVVKVSWQQAASLPQMDSSMIFT